MKALVFAVLFVLSGCGAALIERLSTWPVDSDAKDPSVQVLYSHPGAGNMATYRVLVHNTLYVPISVIVDCSTIGKEAFVIKPRTTHSSLVSGTSGRAPECYVSYVEE